MDVFELLYSAPSASKSASMETGAALHRPNCRQIEQADVSPRQCQPGAPRGSTYCERAPCLERASSGPSTITTRTPSLSAILNWLFRLLPWWSISTESPASRAAHTPNRRPWREPTDQRRRCSRRRVSENRRACRPLQGASTMRSKPRAKPRPGVGRPPSISASLSQRPPPPIALCEPMPSTTCTSNTVRV